MTLGRDTSHALIHIPSRELVMSHASVSIRPPTALTRYNLKNSYFENNFKVLKLRARGFSLNLDFRFPILFKLKFNE